MTKRKSKDSRRGTDLFYIYSPGDRPGLFRVTISRLLRCRAGEEPTYMHIDQRQLSLDQLRRAN